MTGASASSMFVQACLCCLALASLLIALAVVASAFARSRTAPFAFPAGRP